MTNLIYLVDGYKTDHRRQYPEGTEYVYSNFTPRNSRDGKAGGAVFFGLQYFLKKYFGDKARRDLFSADNIFLDGNYESFIKDYLGPEAASAIGSRHILDLQFLGYIPLRFSALPEGTLVPFGVPMFTVENTHPDFFWLTNYFETLISNILWMPCTSATTSYHYRKLLNVYQEKTGGSKEFVKLQGHDFSFRGMSGPEAAALSGAGHLLSFAGTDSIPSIKLLERYYGAQGLVGGSVPATEHSVMCAGGSDNEIDTFRRLLKLYPKGILSVVSDTWDFWKVVTEILPKLKNEIMARDGKLVIRPDSGDPVKILCGDRYYRPPVIESKASWVASKDGLIESLAKIFGTTRNAKGYLELDSHIGAIYGDSITLERAREICAGLENKGLASTNVVLGIGSFSYQFVTRDTLGFAMKATHAIINGSGHMLQKDPKTDDGGKKSAKGRLKVYKDTNGAIKLQDGYNNDEDVDVESNLLRTVWADGKFIRETTLDQIRNTLGVF